MSDVEALIDKHHRRALEIATRARIDPTYATQKEVEKWARRVAEAATGLQGEDRVEFLGVLAGRLSSDPADDAIRMCHERAARARDLASLEMLGRDATPH